jgi:hypothetical protein
MPKKLDRQVGTGCWIGKPAADFRISIAGSIYGNVVRKCLGLGQEHYLSEKEQVSIETDMEAYIAQCTA